MLLNPYQQAEWSVHSIGIGEVPMATITGVPIQGDLTWIAKNGQGSHDPSQVLPNQQATSTHQPNPDQDQDHHPDLHPRLIGIARYKSIKNEQKSLQK